MKVEIKTEDDDGGDTEEGDCAAPLCPASESFILFPDIVPVPISFGGREQRSMLLKQIL